MKHFIKDRYSSYDTNNIGLSKKYNLSLDDMQCPCCGNKLKLTDKSSKKFNENLISIDENVLNENKLADYLLEIIETAAKEIYDDEILTELPETDGLGNIIDCDYNDRFIYANKNLKRIVKVKANAISNMVKNNGIDVSPFYIENELFQQLKFLGYYK